MSVPSFSTLLQSIPKDETPDTWRFQALTLSPIGTPGNVRPLPMEPNVTIGPGAYYAPPVPITVPAAQLVINEANIGLNPFSTQGLAPFYPPSGPRLIPTVQAAIKFLARHAHSRKARRVILAIHKWHNRGGEGVFKWKWNEDAEFRANALAVLELCGFLLALPRELVKPGPVRIVENLMRRVLARHGKLKSSKKDKRKEKNRDTNSRSDEHYYRIWHAEENPLFARHRPGIIRLENAPSFQRLLRMKRPNPLVSLRFPALLPVVRGLLALAPAGGHAPAPGRVPVVVVISDDEDGDEDDDVMEVAPPHPRRPNAASTPSVAAPSPSVLPLRVAPPSGLAATPFGPTLSAPSPALPTGSRSFAVPSSSHPPPPSSSSSSSSSQPQPQPPPATMSSGAAPARASANNTASATNPNLSVAASAVAGHYYVPCPPNTGVTVNGKQGFHNMTCKNMGSRQPYFLLPLAAVAAGSRPVVNLRAADFDHGSDRWIRAMDAAEAGPGQAAAANQPVGTGECWEEDDDWGGYE